MNSTQLNEPWSPPRTIPALDIQSRIASSVSKSVNMNDDHYFTKVSLLPAILKKTNLSGSHREIDESSATLHNLPEDPHTLRCR